MSVKLFPPKNRLECCLQACEAQIVPEKAIFTGDKMQSKDD